MNVSSNWSTSATLGAIARRHVAQACRQLLRGVLARAHGERAPRLVTGEDAGRQRRQQAGPHQRGLPAARRAHHHHAGWSRTHGRRARPPAARGRRSCRRRLPRTGRGPCRGSLPARSPPWPAAAPVARRAGLAAARAAAGWSRRRRRPPPRDTSSLPRIAARRPAACSTRRAVRSLAQRARLLVDQERDAVRQRRPPAGRRRSSSRRARRSGRCRRCRRDRAGRARAANRRSASVSLGRDRRLRTVVTEGADHQHGRRPAPPGEVGDEFEGLGVGHVQVVERQQHGTPARPRRQTAGDGGGEVAADALAVRGDASDHRAGAGDRLVHQRPGALVCVIAPPVQHQRSVVVRLLGELRDQAGLAGALGAEDRHETAVATRGRDPRRTAAVRSRVSRPTNAGPTAVSASGSPATPPVCGVSRGVQSRSGSWSRIGRLQPAQLRARLDPQLVDQHGSGPLVRSQGVAPGGPLGRGRP